MKKKKPNTNNFISRSHTIIARGWLPERIGPGQKEREEILFENNLIKFLSGEIFVFYDGGKMCVVRPESSCVF
jgi:hypothetical protein